MVYIVKNETDIEKNNISCVINGLPNDINLFIKTIKDIIFEEDKTYGILFGTKEEKDLLEFYIYYKTIKSKIEKSIINYNKTHVKSDNKIVDELLLKLFDRNKDGKILRGFLICLGYEIASKIECDPIPLAVAYELFQTSILIHDDIIDKAKFRRNKETIQEEFIREFKKAKDKEHISNSLALCLGDAGLYYVNKIIIDEYKTHKNFNMLFSYYNDIVLKTVYGEILDVYLPFNEKNNLGYNITYKDVYDIYKLKTSYYTMIGPFSLGLILGGETNISKYEEMLLNLGISFQIIDDIFGIFGAEDNIGKSNTSDIKEFKQTILYTYVKNTKYKNKLLKYYRKDNLTTSDIRNVRKIFIESNALNNAKNETKLLLNKSKELLNSIKIKSKYKSIIRGLIIYLENRDK